VKSGALWLLSGPASVWAEEPPAGVVTKAAILRKPPSEIEVSALTPEAVPDAWTGETTTALALAQALAAQKGVVALPWKLVRDVISSAINHGFLRALPSPVAWPCQYSEAGSMMLGLPAKSGDFGETGHKAPGFGDGKGSFQPAPIPSIWTSTLDSAQLASLTEALGDILAAAGSHELRFRLSVELADGSEPAADVRKGLSDAMDKVVAK